MTIEGIPDGWELVRVGKVQILQWYLNSDGIPEQWQFAEKSFSIYPIIRKIEKPKKFRPFANGDEFLSHHLHDGWIKLSSTAFTKVSQFDEKRFWVNNEEACYTWEEGFNLLKFRDGTPFGIEVTE